MKKLLLFSFLFFVTYNIYSQHITNTLGTDGEFVIKDGSSTFLTLTQDSGLIKLAYSLGSTKGSLFKGTNRFLHNYAPTGAEGYNTFRSPSAVDTATHKTIYPLRDIVFEVYADGIPPKTKIDFGGATLYKSGEMLHLGASAEVTLTAIDATSGVENIYISINGSAYKPYTGPIPINEEKEYIIKYY